MLPKNERRKIDKVEHKKIWIYGAPFSGKTTFADKAPNPLMLNSDGNIKFVTAPYIAIKDHVEMRGRIKDITHAWEQFKSVIDELEKGQNDFETIVVDLVEHMYEYARLYIFHKNHWEHESDDSFKSWQMIEKEFLNTFRRLLNLDYNFILISHEDLSRDITKPSGKNITQIKPNLRDKIAVQLAGMVDLVGRVVVEGEDRKLTFKSSPVEFGGGRLPIKSEEIMLDWEEFTKLYEGVGK